MPGRGRAYNEEAFRYLLDVERKRTARSLGSFLLLLVKLKKNHEASDQINQIVATTIFSELGSIVRGADFIGWFRDKRVAAAVLTQDAGAPVTDVSRQIGQRVVETLSSHLPADIACRLRVRVLQLSTPQSD